MPNKRDWMRPRLRKDGEPWGKRPMTPAGKALLARFMALPDRASMTRVDVAAALGVTYAVARRLEKRSGEALKRDDKWAGWDDALIAKVMRMVPTRTVQEMLAELPGMTTHSLRAWLSQHRVSVVRVRNDFRRETQRDRRIIALARRGWTPKQIAREVGEGETHTSIGSMLRVHRVPYRTEVKAVNDARARRRNEALLAAESPSEIA